MKFQFSICVLYFMSVISFGYRISAPSEDCTFTTHNGYALYGHNDVTLPDTPTDTCKQTCLINARCLSVDVNHNTNSCFISYSSRDTAPDAFGKHQSSTYYQKTCESIEHSGYSDDEDDEFPTKTISPKEPCVKKYGPFGGKSGHAFSDSGKYSAGNHVTGVIIRYGGYVDCVGLIYNGRPGTCYGGQGGKRTVIHLEPFEVIISVTGRWGGLVDRITFTSNLRSYGPFGASTGGEAFSAQGDTLVYISGRYGQLLDQINLHFFNSQC